MTNLWIEHVRQFAKENGLSYGCALSTAECRESYKSSKKAPKATPKASKKATKTTAAYSDLLAIAAQAKQMKPKPRAEQQGVVVKRRLNFQKKSTKKIKHTAIYSI